MHNLELKVPPPVVALCSALLMWLAPQVAAPFEVSSLFRMSVALAFVVAGLGLDLAGLVSFLRAHTTINPLKPASTSSLVSTGLYRYTRNPMYLGLLLILLGWALFLGNILAFFVIPVFVLYINRFQITPEERILSSMFGAEFSAYQARTRRWL